VQGRGGYQDQAVRRRQQREAVRTTKMYLLCSPAVVSVDCQLDTTVKNLGVGMEQLIH
jgi:hypothetical protein